VRRYPFAALMDATGLTEAALGRRVGLSGTSLVKARELGLVEQAADRCAVRCGLVPWVVWPDWFADFEVECADRSCEATFVPTRQNHIYCTQKCARRAWARSDKGKASLAAAKARWLETAWEYDRKRERDRKRRLRSEARAA